MDRKKVYSWAMYDWANSVFATTVMAGFFPVFFKAYWSHGTDPLVSTARLGTVISVSSLLVAVLSPLLGALADLRGLKKSFCFLFMLMGVAATISLAFVGQGQWGVAMLAYGLGMMAFNSTAVFYDSLLPSVAKAKDMDYASSLGYSLGYLGGGILFLINVLMYLKPEIFGIKDGVQAVQISFLSVGIWWVIFSLPLAFNVSEPDPSGQAESVLKTMQSSFRRLRLTVADVLKQKNLAIFLMAYWLYIDGVYTVMTMAVDYGMSIGLESKDLITALLLTQFVGFPFALAFGWISKWWGCRKPVLACIVVYILAVIFATKMSEGWHFYALACVIGMVQGGVQSLSRSLFGRMIPESRSGELFGLFNLVGKFASIAGPLVVAVGVTVTQNARMGMLGLIILFIIGAILLYRVEEPQDS